jgi:hypothetical protein
MTKKRKKKSNEIIHILLIIGFFMFRRTSDDQLNNERIRCEHCYAQINRNDWKSHLVNKYYLKNFNLFLPYYRKYVLRNIHVGMKI